jgi:hypothetical protein
MQKWEFSGIFFLILGIYTPPPTFLFGKPPPKNLTLCTCMTVGCESKSILGDPCLCSDTSFHSSVHFAIPLWRKGDAKVDPNSIPNIFSPLFRLLLHSFTFLWAQNMTFCSTESEINVGFFTFRETFCQCIYALIHATNNLGSWSLGPLGSWALGHLGSDLGL